MLIVLDGPAAPGTCRRCAESRIVIRAVDEVFGHWRDQWLCSNCLMVYLITAARLLPEYDR